MAPRFEYAQAAFLGKSGAILLGIASKRAANRAKDRESLPRLVAFREYWIRQRDHGAGTG